MSEKRMRLMDVDEIMRAMGCTDRHARRLRAQQDSRCYTEDFSEPPRKRDVLFELHWHFKRLGEIGMAMLLIEHQEDEYALPDNWEELKEAITAIRQARGKAVEIAGYYHEREPDGSPCSPCGTPSIYERAKRGKSVHVSYRKQLEAWAEKYGHKLDPRIFFGEVDDE